MGASPSTLTGSGAQQCTTALSLDPESMLAVVLVYTPPPNSQQPVANSMEIRDSNYQSMNGVQKSLAMKALRVAGGCDCLAVRNDCA